MRHATSTWLKAIVAASKEPSPSRVADALLHLRNSKPDGWVQLAAEVQQLRRSSTESSTTKASVSPLSMLKELRFRQSQEGSHVTLTEGQLEAVLASYGGASSHPKEVMALLMAAPTSTSALVGHQAQMLKRYCAERIVEEAIQSTAGMPLSWVHAVRLFSVTRDSTALEVAAAAPEGVSAAILEASLSRGVSEDVAKTFDLISRRGFSIDGRDDLIKMVMGIPELWPLLKTQDLIGIARVVCRPGETSMACPPPLLALCLGACRQSPGSEAKELHSQLMRLETIPKNGQRGSTEMTIVDTEELPERVRQAPSQAQLKELLMRSPMLSEGQAGAAAASMCDLCFGAGDGQMLVDQSRTTDDSQLLLAAASVLDVLASHPVHGRLMRPVLKPMLSTISPQPFPLQDVDVASSGGSFPTVGHISSWLTKTMPHTMNTDQISVVLKTLSRDGQGHQLVEPVVRALTGQSGEEGLYRSLLWAADSLAAKGERGPVKSGEAPSWTTALAILSRSHCSSVSDYYLRKGIENTVPVQRRKALPRRAALDRALQHTVMSQWQWAAKTLSGLSDRHLAPWTWDEASDAFIVLNGVLPHTPGKTRRRHLQHGCLLDERVASMIDAATGGADDAWASSSRAADALVCFRNLPEYSRPLPSIGSRLVEQGHWDACLRLATQNPTVAVAGPQTFLAALASVPNEERALFGAEQRRMARRIGGAPFEAMVVAAKCCGTANGPLGFRALAYVQRYSGTNAIDTTPLAVSLVRALALERSVGHDDGAQLAMAAEKYLKELLRDPSLSMEGAGPSATIRAICRHLQTKCRVPPDVLRLVQQGRRTSPEQ